MIKSIEIKVISRQNSKRRIFINEHMKERNLSFSFFDAADKTNITRDGSVFSFNEQKFEINMTSNLFDSFAGRKFIKIGEGGCFISHYMLWKELYESDIDSYLILEDDADVLFDNGGIGRFLSEPKPEFDMILCQSVSPHHINGKKAFEYMTDKINVKLSRGFCDWETTEGTTGYILSKSGAKKLLEYYQENKMLNPVDNFITRCVADRLDTFLCPNYLQVGLANYWGDSEIHYKKENENTQLIEGIVFRYE
jgi:glycosyl transferase family 25